MNEEQRKNFKWVGENYQNLVKNHNNEWIAVFDGRVIEHDKAIAGLKTKIDKNHAQKKNEILIEFVTDKKFPAHDL